MELNNKQMFIYNTMIERANYLSILGVRGPSTAYMNVHFNWLRRTSSIIMSLDITINDITETISLLENNKLIRLIDIQPRDPWWEVYTPSMLVKNKLEETARI